MIFIKKEPNDSARFFRNGGKTKCHGCRINRSKMPEPAVTTKEQSTLLQCGCKIKEAIVEEVFVKLGIIGDNISKEKKEEGSGWKALGRPERERILIILDMFGHDLNDLIELTQDNDD
jgi:hypothetical protein